jgi:hypothetical protein
LTKWRKLLFVNPNLKQRFRWWWIALWFAVLVIVPLIAPGHTRRGNIELVAFAAFVLLGFIVAMKFRPPNRP